tara:strand:- start:928 stop:1293 length:366 start_codon:yes stop_codon:yes gene_type:complete
MKMYNYKIIVDYDVNGDDDTNYKKFFLKAMNLESYDGKKIMEIFDYLLDKIGENPFFEHLFTKKYNIPFIGNNKKDIIPILFSYQSFFYMHKCLQSYFETKTVNEKYMKDLDESLDYLVKK